MQHIGLIEIVAAAAFFCYLAWLVVFMQWVRPRIMTGVGALLGTPVTEAHGTHGWEGMVPATNHDGLMEADPEAPLGQRVLVGLADVTVLLVFIVGPLAGLGGVGFLLADSGRLYRWEGEMTGTAVRMTDVAVQDMHGRQSTVVVVVENQSSVPATACAVSKGEYTAADGYMNVFPRGEWFDLAPGESRTTTVQLRAQQTVPGTHRLRLRVECDNRRKDQIDTTIRVES